MLARSSDYKLFMPIRKIIRTNRISVPYKVGGYDTIHNPWNTASCLDIVRTIISSLTECNYFVNVHESIAYLY